MLKMKRGYAAASVAARRGELAMKNNQILWENIHRAYINTVIRERVGKS